MMPSSSALAEQTTSPSPSASKGATSSTQPIEPAPAQRLLFAVSSKTAWRATVGDCDTPGKVERSTDGTNFTQVAVVAADVTSYSDVGLAAATTYTYRVRAYNSTGNSAYSTSSCDIK